MRLKASSRDRSRNGGLLGKLAGLLLLAALALAGWWLWQETRRPPAPPLPPPVPGPSPSAGTPTPTPVIRAYLSNGVPVFVTNAVIPAAPAPTPIPRPTATNPPSTQVPHAPRTTFVPPSPETSTGARTVRDDFETQLALARRGLSPGSLDGVAGGQTRAAIRAFQRQQGLPMTGALDTGTRQRLLIREPTRTTWTVSAADLAGLAPVSATWLGKSQQDRLDHETLLERVAEKTWSSPNLIQRLNPGIDWANVAPGTVLTVPSVEPPPVSRRAALVRIELSARALQVFDEVGGLLAHFPCSIAQRVDKRPVGELRVAVLAPDPNYTFDPAIFPESAEARALGRRLILPPGPNNPVGVAWIGLDRPGYGIHGTPAPEQVGRTESHGCFRLANWNARHLLRLVSVGTPVEVVP